MSSAIPNFFLVGAPKAGTTAFLRYLEQHPAVFVSPIKEPSFFAPEVAERGPEAREGVRRDREALRKYLDQPLLERRSGGVVFEWDQYLKLFKGVRQETAIGEGSVSYLATPGSAAAIRARVPEARILMILRDPAERLRSAWAAAVASGADCTFIAWLNGQLERECARVPRSGHVWAGFYTPGMQRFLDVFPARQVKPIFYHEYVANPQATLRDVFAFLGVDPGWTCDLSRIHNATVAPRWPWLHRLSRPVRRAARHVLPREVNAVIRDRWTRPFRPVITPEERAQAIAIYQNDIRALAVLLQKDLSSWLDPNRM